MQIHIQWTNRGAPTVTLAASGMLTGSALERSESWDPSKADKRAWSGWKAGLFAGVARSQGWFGAEEKTGRLSRDWGPERGQRRTGLIAGKVNNQRQKQVGHSWRETTAGPGQKKAGSSSGSPAGNHWTVLHPEWQRTIWQCCQLSRKKSRKMALSANLHNS